MFSIIAGPVGDGCKNASRDVKTVQILLNMNLGKLSPMVPLVEDGSVGAKTVEAIGFFQKTAVMMGFPDGKVEPGGATLQKLAEGIPGTFCGSTLKGIYLNATEDLIQRYSRPLLEKMAHHGIDTALRISHFLAQVGEESCELRYCEEIASGAAYEGRKDLGNTQPGDGVRFKGRGLIQLTGRANYVAYGKARGMDFTTPEGAALLASDPQCAVDVACWFWTGHGLNALADQDDITGITRRINGGLNGFDERQAKLNRAKFFLKLV